ncbi:MAG: acetoacetate--CoA ligase [Gammaproteobacteria bacterium]|nr:acetoacetate--CoA ligase [Gammaproteobacteria bacterium]
MSTDIDFQQLLEQLHNTPSHSPEPDSDHNRRLAAFTPPTPFSTLHTHSITHREAFWRACLAATGIITHTQGDQTLQRGDHIWQDRWFPGTQLNFAENLLRYRDDHAALIFADERGNHQTLSYAQLAEQVTHVAAWLRDQGVQPGDRVAGFAANRIETVVAMLAATSLGAIWSSCSPDFGVNGVLDRFSQIEPVALFAVNSHVYAGKQHSHHHTLDRLATALPSLKALIVLPELYDASEQPKGSDNCKVHDWQSCVEFSKGSSASSQTDKLATEVEALSFYPADFDHPLFIMYSSGTTGVPKCIVHGTGGTLLQLRKEHHLHLQLTRDDTLFFFTTCGWMMWNWLVTGLASGATLVLFDGSPFHPRPDILFDLCDELDITLLGVSARYLAAAEKAGVKPLTTHRLSALRALMSTGSPLSEEGFDYVWRDIKPGIHLQSMSGGTDIISCFVLGNPWQPVNRGEIQGAGLGMDVAVYNEAGQPVVGEKGELVCRQSFPSMPVGFWNDTEDQQKYRAAYFEGFDNVWTHGDYAEQTANGGWIIYGRSDTVLNPGGVRIGTAEIYRQVEQVDEVLECVAVGQEWDGDIRIVLFVRLRDEATLDEALQARIRQIIRHGASPRHVPALMEQVLDIPRTLNGKIAETAVREAIHGRPVKNQDSLANPQSLREYEAFAERHR